MAGPMSHDQHGEKTVAEGGDNVSADTGPQPGHRSGGEGQMDCRQRPSQKSEVQETPASATPSRAAHSCEDTGSNPSNGKGSGGGWATPLLAALATSLAAPSSASRGHVGRDDDRSNAFTARSEVERPAASPQEPFAAAGSDVSSETSASSAAAQCGSSR